MRLSVCPSPLAPHALAPVSEAPWQRMTHVRRLQGHGWWACIPHLRGTFHIRLGALRLRGRLVVSGGCMPSFLAIKTTRLA